MEPSSLIKNEPQDVKKTEKIDPLLADFYSELNPTKPKSEEPVKSEPTTETKEVEKQVIEQEKPKEKDPLLDDFYSEIDDIKTEEFKSSSKEQLERLLRPGSTYFNLNPFEVLQIDPYATIDEIKRKYRKVLSIYVHPDKNPNEKEKAQIAFEAVNRAYKLLDNETERKKCLEVVEEAKERVDTMCEEKRKKAKKELKEKKLSSGETEVKIEEDDPDKYRHAIYVMTCKLFADIERLKVREAEKAAEEKKRKAAEKAEDESKCKVKKEWDKNYEDSREKRINSWQTFVSKGSTSSTAKSVPVAPPKFVGTGFRPPQHKPEKR